jgi:hypothetical protein
MHALLEQRRVARELRKEAAQQRATARRMMHMVEKQREHLTSVD